MMTKNTTPIIFLHGALGVAADLAPLMAHLQDKGFSTLSFNFAGHGVGSQAPQEFRIDFFARELDLFIKQHQLKNPIVFGYSMGGYVALYYQANYEDSPISQIITYGTKFNWSEKALTRELPMLDPLHLQEKFPQFAHSLKEKHGESWKHILRSTAHMMQNLEKLDGLTKSDLQDVGIPVTFILGDLDRMVSTEETALTASWIKHAQFKTLAHSKHELERSNLKELSEIVAEIIE